MNDRPLVPADDVEHDLDEDCVCGPTVLFEPGGKVVVHHGLDGREALERA